MWFKKDMGLKMTVKHYSYTYTIESPHGDYTLPDVMDDFVKPMLLAMGFHQDNIDDYFEEKSALLKALSDDCEEHF